MGQRWPGERSPRKTLGSVIRAIYFRIKWWRLWLAGMCAPRRTVQGQSPRASQ
jgi:hypothetical protein